MTIKLGDLYHVKSNNNEFKNAYLVLSENALKNFSHDPWYSKNYTPISLKKLRFLLEKNHVTHIAIYDNYTLYTYDEFLEKWYKGFYKITTIIMNDGNKKYENN